MIKKAVVLLSGGLDSATCCAWARAEGFNIYAMSFNYGQRHRIELAAAAKVASSLGVVQHRIVDIDLASFGGSALTTGARIPKRSRFRPTTHVPCTYVPARNTIFLSFALGWAEVIGAGDIYIGVNAVDYSGYPDCRPEYIKAFQKMANLATKAAIEGHQVKIHTPLIKLTKAQIIRKGLELGVDFSLTHSCYDPAVDGKACGECDSCLLRKKGFKEAAVKDPTIYRI